MPTPAFYDTVNESNQHGSVPNCMFVYCQYNNQIMTTKLSNFNSFYFVRQMNLIGTHWTEINWILIGCNLVNLDSNIESCKLVLTNLRTNFNPSFSSFLWIVNCFKELQVFAGGGNMQWKVDTSNSRQWGKTGRRRQKGKEIFYSVLHISLLQKYLISLVVFWSLQTDKMISF